MYYVQVGNVSTCACVATLRLHKQLVTDCTEMHCPKVVPGSGHFRFWPIRVLLFYRVLGCESQHVFSVHIAFVIMYTGVNMLYANCLLGRAACLRAMLREEIYVLCGCCIYVCELVEAMCNALFRRERCLKYIFDKQHFFSPVGGYNFRVVFAAWYWLVVGM